MMTSRNGRTVGGPPRTNMPTPGEPPPGGVPRTNMPTPGEPPPGFAGGGPPGLAGAVPPGQDRQPQAGAAMQPMPPGAISGSGGAVSAMPPTIGGVAPGGRPAPRPMPVDRQPQAGGAPQPFPMPPMQLPPTIGGSGGFADAMPPAVSMSPAMQGLEGLIAGGGVGGGPQVETPGQPRQRASSRELAKLAATRPGRQVF